MAKTISQFGHNASFSHIKMTNEKLTESF